MLLFSRGREWEGTGQYGDLCCPKQLNTLFLFLSLVVVSATELAQTERKWGKQTEKDRDGSLHAAVCCSVYTTSTIKCVLTFCHYSCSIL